jgi:hypothetical protein
MLRQSRVLVIIGAFAILVALGSIVYNYRHFFPIYVDNLMTPEEAAWYLVHDRQHGYVATRRLGTFGKYGLECLQRESDDFRKLNSRNSIPIAKLLADSTDRTATDISTRLYESKDERTRLVGAVGLAAHHELSDPSFVLRMKTQKDPFSDKTELAQIALSYVNRRK